MVRDTLQVPKKFHAPRKKMSGPKVFFSARSLEKFAGVIA
jgi:hypothetical protein